MTGHSGTTCWEIALVSSVFTAGFVLYALGACYLPSALLVTCDEHPESALVAPVPILVSLV